MADEDRVLPVDLQRYARGNTGASHFHRFDSGQAGPHLMIVALAHGNEWCGAFALRHLLERGVRPAVGTLTLGFLNVAAANARATDSPESRRYVDEDFNRLWSPDMLDSARTSCELARAREIRPLVDAADHLLDLHSMQTRGPPLALAGMTAKGLVLCRRLGMPRDIIRDRGHPEGTRLRDYRWFADESDERSSVLVECGQHTDPASVDVATGVAYRFLAAFGLLRDADRPADLPRPGITRAIAVTGLVSVTTDSFRFVRDFDGLEVVPKAGSIVAYDGARPVVTPHDNCVLIMPSPRIRAGQTALRFGRIEDR
jgi:predicted deacylase